MEHYEHILKVMENMTAVMERSPSAFRSIGEEDLRHHFLVQLNGHFEGAATGETFNVSGRTDILLRANGRNVFIAECKFWRGPKGYREAIDQLLAYKAWRDTKTGIVIFCRDTALTTVLEGITSETPRHASFKRSVEWKHETGARYVLHHPGDPNCELILTVLAFDVPGGDPGAYRGEGRQTPSEPRSRWASRFRCSEAPMKKQSDPVIDEIREVRHRISARFDHDPKRLVAHYMEYQKQYQDRLIETEETSERPVEAAT